jgi:hypothetical protein
VSSRLRGNISGVLLCLCIILFPAKIFSQQANVPLNYNWIQESEAKMVQGRGFPLYYPTYEADSVIRKLIADTSVDVFIPLHSSMRPWIEQGHPLRKNVILQNTHGNFIKRLCPNGDMCEPNSTTLKKRIAWKIGAYHYQNSLINVERKPQNGEPLFRLYVDPLLNLQYINMMDDGNDTISGKYYINTRGINAHGDIGTKISFETSFYENQAFFPGYIRDFANSSSVIPGQGRWKTFKVDTADPSHFGYDYAMATGYLSYTPCRHFNVQVGSGKHFVGDGYRSLLLSDNSFSYPYARLTGWFGPANMFQYTAIYVSLMNLYSNSAIPFGTERLFQKKAATFYQFSANIGRMAEVSIFQGLIWKAADDHNKQCIRLAYVNPVMLTSVFSFGLNDEDNYLLGGTFHVDILKTLRLYGQFVADDFGDSIRHKTGFQLGVKYYNAFTLKHLHLQFEFNKVNPYTYSANDSMQAYSHYNQPLAHPLGANFTEISASLQYKIGDFYLHARFTTAKIGADTAGHVYGQDIFISNAFADHTTFTGGNQEYFGRGQQTTLATLDASIGYMVSYASNLNIALGFTDRNLTAGATLDHTRYVYVAIRTSLTNNYLDFFSK